MANTLATVQTNAFTVEAMRARVLAGKQARDHERARRSTLLAQAGERPSAESDLMGWPVAGIDNVTDDIISCRITVNEDKTLSLRIGGETFARFGQLTPELKATIFNR
jgi:hypothetical protein